MSSDNNSSDFIKTPAVPQKTVQKKRGRPKKSEIEQKNNTIFSDNEDEEIILQFPLTDNNDDESSEKNAFTMRDDSDSDNDDTSENLQITQSSENSDNVSTTKQLLNEMKKKDALIKKLKDSLSQYKKTPTLNTEVSGNSSVKLLNMKLINIHNNKPVVIEKTHISCWWCAHEFSTMPCFIPDRICDDTYYVFGCFCSYSCALAYNLELNDSRTSIRTSLIKQICKMIFGNSSVGVAGKKELLTKFGGNQSIEQFRKNAMLCTKEYKMKIPPVIPLLLEVNESI